jgi:hypothetical protein
MRTGPHDPPYGAVGGLDEAFPARTVGIPVYPLTSVFTPAPSCSSLYLSVCHKDACSAYIGAESYLYQDRNLISSAPETLSCYPEAPVMTTAVQSSPRGVFTGFEFLNPTYSPGLFCPHGMTIATILESIDAAYCCYRYVRYPYSLCDGT